MWYIGWTLTTQRIETVFNIIQTQNSFFSMSLNDGKIFICLTGSKATQEQIKTILLFRYFFIRFF